MISMGETKEKGLESILEEGVKLRAPLKAWPSLEDLASSSTFRRIALGTAPPKVQLKRYLRNLEYI